MALSPALRCACALSALLLCAPGLRAAIDPVEDVLRQPFDDEQRAMGELSTRLHRAGRDESTLLYFAAERRALARLAGDSLGEPITIAQAIAREKAAKEPIDSAFARVKARVEVRYPASAAVEAAAIPAGFRPAGAGAWVRRRLMPEALLVAEVRNGLAVPVLSVETEFFGPGGSIEQQQYFVLRCRPIAEAFAPGSAQPALCSGEAGMQALQQGVEAYARREVHAPFPVMSVETATAWIAGTEITYPRAAPTPAPVEAIARANPAPVEAMAPAAPPPPAPPPAAPSAVGKAAHAKVEGTRNVPAQWRAMPDSAFIRQLLSLPFTASHESNQSGVQLLRDSGNEEEARALERAESARLLAVLMKEPFDMPRTFGDAIGTEQPGEPVEQQARAALQKVTIDYAPPQAVNAMRLPEGFTALGGGVWSHPEWPEALRVLVLVTVRNDLPATLRRIDFRIDDRIYRCPASPGKPSEDFGEYTPGVTTALCWHSDRIERAAEPAKSLAAHGPAMAVHPFFIESREVEVNVDRVAAAQTRDDRGRDAGLNRLAQTPCNEKGTCAVVRAAEDKQREDSRRGYNENVQGQRATWESPFIQRLLKRPLDDANARDAAYLLEASGHREAAAKLLAANQRRALAALTGEPFEGPRMIGEAIAWVATAAPDNARDARALERVKVDPPQHGVKRVSAVRDGFRLVGEGAWMQELTTHRNVELLMVVGNDLSAPVKWVQVRFANPDTRPDYFADPFFTCKPDDGGAFAPGATQVALCEGALSLESDRMLDMLAKRSTPMRMHSISSAEVNAGSLSPNPPDPTRFTEASRVVMAASCEDKGTCSAVRTARARDDVKRHAHELLIAMAVVAALLAAIVAARVKPRADAGWLLSVLAALLAAWAVLDVAAMWLLVRPGAGNEGLLAFVFIWYGGLPYLVAIAIVGGGALAGSMTRIRAFAITFAALVAVAMGIEWALLT